MLPHAFGSEAVPGNSCPTLPDVQLLPSPAVSGQRSLARAVRIGVGAVASPLRVLRPGYVVMPEHVHLLMSEPERGTLASAVQAMKQSVSRKLIAGREHFWQARYYDFNVWTAKKRIEKRKYIHRNPVVRGLVERPQDWAWSSLRHYMNGEAGTVEICLLYTSPSPRDGLLSRMPSSA